ncbi:MAG TPA: PGPGW domain-containing protein [Mycobacteriales bacterium]|jgi:uncharacterized protein (TIGR02611 family)|nr:PGPGW domain-containing protein [Mycobacteriales bacterium]
MTEVVSRPGSVARIGRTVTGIVVVLAGFVLLPLPGPGSLVILAGLAVLARDHVWAARLLNRGRAAAALTGRALTRRHDSNVEPTRPEGPQ